MIARKIAYNTIISAASRIAGTIVALFIIGLTTRYLGQNGFGDYSTILAFLYVFSVLADLGLNSIALREISKSGAAESEIVSHAFSLRFWSGLAVFGIAPLAAWLFPYPAQVKIGVAIAAFGYWCLSVSGISVVVFQKYLKMEKVALAELAGRLAQLALVVFCIWKNYGFLSIVLTTSVSSLVNLILIYLFAQKYIPMKLTWNLAYWRKMIRASLPLAISAVFVMVYFKLDTVMLSLMKPSGDVGIYGAAYKILENLIFFPAMFVGLVMPLLSKYAFVDGPNFRRVAQKTFDLLLIFASPLVFGGLILSGPIIHLIAGSQFSAAAGVLNILILATSIIFFGSLFSNMIIALEKQKSLAKIYGLGAAVNFGVNLILIPRFSYWGAAGSTLFTELLVTVLMMTVIKKTVGSLPNFGLVWKVIFASLAMALALWALGDLNLFILLPLGGLVYFLALLGFGGISISETLALIRRQSPNI